MEKSSLGEPMVASNGSPQIATNESEVRSVQHCNFRSSGCGSDEVQRVVAEVHEALARKLQFALESYLNTEVAIKFKEFTHGPITGYLGSVLPLNYLSVALINVAPFTMALEGTDNFSSLVLDVLLGGKTETVTAGSKLSEIEEELMLDVASVILREVEKAWDLPPMLMQSRRVDASALGPYFRAEQGLVVAIFEVVVSGCECQLKLVCPAAAMGMLARKIECKSTNARRLPDIKRPLSDRVLDCEVSISAELTKVKVLVKDLMVLRSGAVLKLLVPVDTPIALILAERQIFDAAIVKNQDHRAAHVGHHTLLVEGIRI